jgi:hypothetical protein
MAIQQVHSWLKEQLRAVDGSPIYHPSRRLTLFRYEVPGCRPDPVISVSDEAFEDHGPETIIGDLQLAHVAEHMCRSPSTQLLYTSRRTVTVATD